jgi:undecaprenyl-diphosphatase
MVTIQLILLAIMQGITELFPISSLGHTVLIPGILNWQIDQNAEWFLPFIVATHFCTATALFIYFWRDWWALFSNFIKDKGRPVSPESKLLWLLFVGTVPAGILGLSLEHFIQKLFGSVPIAATFLAINGAILIAGDRLRKREGGKTLPALSWQQAFVIGCAQALALIPGISRSGVTLISGLAAGLDYASSARFSFLLATPIIGAAGLLEIPKLFDEGTRGNISGGVIILCGLLSGFFAYLSTAFLMRYFKNHDVTALRPFGIYCLIAGVGALLLYLI